MMGIERRSGILLAALTAVISGVAVFVNGFGVRAWTTISDSTTYTALKNGAAAVALILLAVIATGTESRDLRSIRRHWRGLLAVAVVGGSLPFLLFFEGLAQSTSTGAAFIHKTLVVWVAVLAVAFLRERLTWAHGAAIALLVIGQAVMSATPTSFGRGELMILGATGLWSVETIIAKKVLAAVPPLTLGVFRMTGGAVILILFALARGGLSSLSGVTGEHVVWIVVTAFTLSAYVATWFAALARAQAVDVTAVLVTGALITAFLESGVRGAALPSPLGMGLVAAGAALALIAAGVRSQYRLEGR
jgi:drug/metabolite transporter (DMT)-like permease